MNKKIKIAFVKYAGLSAGGSEKLLQIIAANLPPERFEVDYFFCDASPYIGSDYKPLGTDPYRKEYMERSGVRLREFHVGAKDVTTPFHTWVGTDFWNKFNEADYDIIQTCRAGHKEYPFNKIRSTPIVDIIALSSGVDNQYNIARVMHICQWSADGWINRGGDSKRVALISLPIEPPTTVYKDLQEQLELTDKFVYGFHQRPDDKIFSEIPLAAYALVQNDHTAFVLMGGGEKYRSQARELGIKNIHFLPATGNQEEVYRFLATLQVYAHGRKDGEVNSQAMGEAMYFGLPLVSHYSTVNNGHVECIGEAGLVVTTVDEYAHELKKLLTDSEYYKYRTAQSKHRFLEKYELQGQMKNIIAIYYDIIKNPFPHTIHRFLSSINYSQTTRVWAAIVYFFVKYRVCANLLNIKRDYKNAIQK